MRHDMRHERRRPPGEPIRVTLRDGSKLVPLHFEEPLRVHEHPNPGFWPRVIASIAVSALIGVALLWLLW